MSTYREIIPPSEVSVRFVRSSGPGGQNVNKVNTKAVLHFAFADSAVLSAEIKARIRGKFANRVNARGELVLSCDTTRSQSRNLDECWEKLEAILRSAAVRPKVRKRRKTPQGVKERRMKNKRAVSQKKASRRVRIDD